MVGGDVFNLKNRFVVLCFLNAVPVMVFFWAVIDSLYIAKKRLAQQHQELLKKHVGTHRSNVHRSLSALGALGGGKKKIAGPAKKKKAFGRASVVPTGSLGPSSLIAQPEGKSTDAPAPGADARRAPAQADKKLQTAREESPKQASSSQDTSFFVTKT